MNIDDQPNQCWKLIIKIHTALLGCAKEKMNENRIINLNNIINIAEYFFRLQFEYKNKMDEKEGMKVKTSKHKLIETEMNFHDEMISLYYILLLNYLISPSVNIELGLIEIRMVIGTQKIGKRFNPSIIMIKDLDHNIEDKVKWKFSANSIVNLSYQLQSLLTNDNQLSVLDSENNTLNNYTSDSTLLVTFTKPFSEYSSQEIQRESELKGSIIKDKINSIERTLKKSNSSNIQDANTDKHRLSERNMSRTQCQKPSVEIKSTVIETNQHFNNFCEGFFLTSFPANNGQIIENSKQFVSSCKHKICSMLPAMEPEILYRFPFEDTKDLELNNLAASICFPSGIKICYEQKHTPIAPKNYFVPITNQQGERYYMMTYHYYLKMEFTEYNKEYSMNPLKYFLNKFGENYYDIIDIKEEEKARLEDDLDICGELGFSEYVYIPFAFALISKYPYIKAMESCLNSMMQILIKSKDMCSIGSKIGQIVSFLINSVPIPQPNSKIVFSLPYELNHIEVEGPVYKDKFLSKINLDLLLSRLSIDNIIQIYCLMLLEQKILFVDTEHNSLSQIIEAFLSLLFPIEWINTYIPIMSEKMTQYLQTFLPFINGINENLISQALSVLSEAEERIFIVYINTNTITYSNSKQEEEEEDPKEEENTKFNIPDIPIEIKETLKKKLFEIQSIKTKQILNLCVKNAFIEAFSTMFFDFKDYLYKIDDFTVFDTKMLLNNREEEDHAFYKEVTESQLFINFIQNISKNEDDYIYFNNILNNLKINKDNTCINQFKHTTNQTDVVHFYMKHNFIHSTYIIKPLFCEKEMNEQSQMAHLKINKNAFCLSDQSSQVLSEEKRVITKPWTLNKTDYPLLIERYVIPGIDKSTVRKRPQTIFNKVDMIEKNMEKNKTQTIIKRSKKEYELTRNQKEDIKEIIKDTLSSIFRSGVDINITPALQEIYRSFGREFFCKLVYQTNSIKKIQPDCFNQLVKLFLNGLISMCNISENDNTLECAVQLTKSSFYYCKGNTGDFLYDELKMKLKDYFLWLKDSFWFKWLDVDLKERSNTEEKEKEKTYIKLIENICDKMLKLQINKEYIIKFINSLLVVYVSKVILIKFNANNH